MASPRVIWDDARQALRGDTYVLGDRIFEAIELYCVESDCDCGEVIVDFDAVAPRGAPHPGHVEFDGSEVTLVIPDAPILRAIPCVGHGFSGSVDAGSSDFDRDLNLGERTE